MADSSNVRIFGAATPSGVALIAVYPGKPTGSDALRESVADCFWMFTGESRARALRVRATAEMAQRRSMYGPDDVSWERVLLAAATRVNTEFWNTQHHSFAPFPRLGGRDNTAEHGIPALTIEDLVSLAWTYHRFVEEVVARTASVGLREELRTAIASAARIESSEIEEPPPPQQAVAKSMRV